MASPEDIAILTAQLNFNEEIIDLLKKQNDVIRGWLRHERAKRASKELAKQSYQPETKEQTRQIIDELLAQAIPVEGLPVSWALLSTDDLTRVMQRVEEQRSRYGDPK